MYTVRVETPSGAQSRGYDRPTEEQALKVFAQVVEQIRAMTRFAADVILSEDRTEIQREHIDNAARR